MGDRVKRGGKKGGWEVELSTQKMGERKRNLRHI
jgi:hypothetical protein